MPLSLSTSLTPQGIWLRESSQSSRRSELTRVWAGSLPSLAYENWSSPELRTSFSIAFEASALPSARFGMAPSARIANCALGSFLDSAERRRVAWLPNGEEIREEPSRDGCSSHMPMAPFLPKTHLPTEPPPRWFWISSLSLLLLGVAFFVLSLIVSNRESRLFLAVIPVVLVCALALHTYHLLNAEKQRPTPDSTGEISHRGRFWTGYRSNPASFEVSAGSVGCSRDGPSGLLPAISATLASAGIVQLYPDQGPRAKLKTNCKRKRSSSFTLLLVLKSKLKSTL
jgi:hypothetical protein